jgi:tetratricopeptide (TPR) repeat protein
VSPVLAVVSVAALALVAAAGVAAGFRRRDPIAVEPAPDPLDDRRLALLRSLSDLEEAHTSGALDDDDYGRLRDQTEGRMARVLHAIDERGRLAAEVAAPSATRAPGRVPSWAVATLLAATVGAVLVAGLLREAEPTPASTSAQAQDPLAFSERRVLEHPEDVAARLDLADRYLDAARIEESLAQYTVALELDPDNAEAHARVGLILLLADRPEDALESVDRALATSPDYPEALFIRGWILLEGLDRPDEAIESLERYLEAAPFGAERDRAEALIEQARAAPEG